MERREDLASDLEDLEEIYSPGARVRHPVLGVGQVIEWIGNPGGYRRPIIAWDDSPDLDRTPMSCDPQALKPDHLM